MITIRPANWEGLLCFMSVAKHNKNYKDIIMPENNTNSFLSDHQILQKFGVNEEDFKEHISGFERRVLLVLFRTVIEHAEVDDSTHDALFEQSDSGASKFSEAFGQKLANFSAVELLDLIHSLLEVDEDKKNLSPDSKDKFISIFVANLSDEHKANLIDYINTQIFGDQNDFSAGLKEELKNLDDQTVTQFIKLIVKNQEFKNELKIAFPEKGTKNFDDAIKAAADALVEEPEFSEKVADKVGRKRKFLTIAFSLICLGSASIAIFGFNPKQSIFGISLELFGLPEIPGLATGFQDTMKVRRKIDELILTSVCNSNKAEEIFSKQSCDDLIKHFAENDAKKQ